MRKLCPACEIEKDESEFYVDKRRSAPAGYCKDCWNEKSTKRLSEWSSRLAGYGITREEYDALVVKQDGKCAICGTRPERRLSIDHCHATGRVRGLLCAYCNLALGWYEKTHAEAERYIAYLEEY